MTTIRTICPRDGSRLVLDREHLIDYAHGCGLTRVPDDEILDRYARGDFVPTIPVMFRCAAGGHTVLDREPERSLSRATIARQKNGKQPKHFRPRRCAICDEMISVPTGARQHLCATCGTLPRCSLCGLRHAREASCVTLRVG